MGQSNLAKLPQGWVWSNLRALYDIVGGGTPSTTVTDYWKGKIPWITSADIHGPKDLRPRRAISEKAIANSTTNLVPSGSLIVVTRVGLGKIAITDHPLCFSQDSQALVGINELLDPKYALYYLSMAVQIFKYENRGTTISGVTKKQLADLQFPLAPTNEQVRVVEKIEELITKLDAGVEALHKSQAQLERYRLSVLKAAVTGELTNQWREAHQAELEPASELLSRILKERRERWEADQLKRMKAGGNTPENDDWKKKYIEPTGPDPSDLPKLPSRWIWTRAEQLCGFITKGTTPSAGKLFAASGDIPFIKVYNLTHVGVLDFSRAPTFVAYTTHTGELARSKVYPGDVLMNIVGPPLGKVSIVPNSYAEWNINQAVAVFRPMPSFDRRYLSFCLLTESIQSWAVRRAKATAGQFNLTLEICRDLPLPLPPLAEQERIDEELERLLSIADAMENTLAQSLKQAERMRQSILNQAFEGKLVPQDPNDEPAELLLERIKIERAKREAEKSAASKPDRGPFKKKQNKRIQGVAA